MGKILYLGLQPPVSSPERPFIHCPLIETVAKPFGEHAIESAFEDHLSYSHLLFTSQTAVALHERFSLHYAIPLKIWQKKQVIAVGSRTADVLRRIGFTSIHTAKEETAEGVVSVLKEILPNSAHLLWPKAQDTRPIIENFLTHEGIAYQAPSIYTTKFRNPSFLPQFTQFEAIVFTSPSIVKAFHHFFGPPPKGPKLLAIGPITKAALVEIFQVDSQSVEKWEKNTD